MASSMACRRLVGLSLHSSSKQILLYTKAKPHLSFNVHTLSSVTSFFNGVDKKETESKLPEAISTASDLTAMMQNLKIATRSFSSNPETISTREGNLANQPQVITSPDGRQYAAFELSKQKLKPYIVKRRLARMKTFVGTEKNIRHSPWRLNLVCQLAAGLPLEEALNQLEFCKKSKAPLVQKVLSRTANLADIRDGLQPSQLEVAECFATKGTPLKRVKTMGRGRSGRMERQHSHFRVVLREIDFKLRLYQAKTIGQKKRWFMLQQRAEQDRARVEAEREEIKRLEKQAKAAADAKKKA